MPSIWYCSLTSGNLLSGKAMSLSRELIEHGLGGSGRCSLRLSNWRCRSSGNGFWRQPLRASPGAAGLCQLLQAQADRYARRDRVGADPQDRRARWGAILPAVARTRAPLGPRRSVVGKAAKIKSRTALRQCRYCPLIPTHWQPEA